jgi:hypothetical protein
VGKKLQSKPKWKAHIRRRQLYQLERQRERNRAFGVQKRRQIVPQNNRHDLASLSAPTIFCILENPEGVISYLNRLKDRAIKDNILVDLHGVTKISAQTVALLIATMHDVQEYAAIKGNQPVHDESRAILINSGFFEHVRSAEPVRTVKQGGVIQNRTMKRVDPKVAQELIHLGTKALHGKPTKQKAAYKALIEVMGNTHNHATERRGQKPWWAMVYGDDEKKRICYAFLDTGVGIFKSVRLGPFRRAYRKMKLFGGNASILRDILKGNIESSTGIPYRGKGLPAIYAAANSKRIQSLIVIANDVYANVSEDDYRVMNVEFGGTLLYWETD